MSGNERWNWPASAGFYLDENLPPSVAEALRLVGYPITDGHRENKSGAGDEELIPWMAERGYAWVTRDHAAKRAHAQAIRSSGLSVVWVRGIGRGRGQVTEHVLHSMLTQRLPQIADAIAEARGPLHYELYAHGDPRSPIAVARRLDFDRIARRQARRTN